MRKIKRFPRRGVSQQRGVAVTELAVCLPMLVLIVLATIETCTLIFVQQSLSIAAYEGARVSLVPDVTDANVVFQCETILQGRDVQDFTTSVTPTDIPNAAVGTWIRVETSAPFSSNSLVGGWLFNGRTLSASVEMRKER